MHSRFSLTQNLPNPEIRTSSPEARGDIVISKMVSTVWVDIVRIRESMNAFLKDRIEREALYVYDRDLARETMYQILRVLDTAIWLSFDTSIGMTHLKKIWRKFSLTIHIHKTLNFRYLLPISNNSAAWKQ